MGLIQINTSFLRIWVSKSFRVFTITNFSFTGLMILISVPSGIFGCSAYIGSCCILGSVKTSIFPVSLTAQTFSPVPFNLFVMLADWGR